MCSAPAFYAWLRLPLICLKLFVGVCARDGLAAFVCVCRTSAAFVAELLPRGWRTIAFPRCSLASCSKLLDVAHSHGSSLLRWLVCTRRACLFCLRMWHFCCFRWTSASEFARRRFLSVASCSKLLDVAHCSLLHQLLCFGYSYSCSLALIVIQILNYICRAASSGS